MPSSSKRIQLAAAIVYTKLQATCINQSSAHSWNSISPICTNQSDCVKRACLFLLVPLPTLVSLDAESANRWTQRLCGLPTVAASICIPSLNNREKKTEDWWNLELHMEHVYHSWLFLLRSKHLKVLFQLSKLNVRKIDTKYINTISSTLVNLVYLHVSLLLSSTFYK
jgi:hypothetical protein